MKERGIALAAKKGGNEKVRSMARFLQARMETQLALPRWIRNHRNRNHQVLPWPYR